MAEESVRDFAIKHGVKLGYLVVGGVFFVLAAKDLLGGDVITLFGLL